MLLEAIRELLGWLLCISRYGLAQSLGAVVAAHFNGLATHGDLDGTGIQRIVTGGTGFSGHLVLLWR